MITLIDDIRENVSLTWKYRTPLDSTILGPQLNGAINPGLIGTPSSSIEGTSLSFQKLQCYIVPWSSDSAILAQHQNALVRLELQIAFSLFFNEVAYGALTLQMIWQEFADPLVKLNFVPISELEGVTPDEDSTHQIVLGYLSSDSGQLTFKPEHGDYTTQALYQKYSRCDFIRPISLREAKKASITNAAVTRTLSHSTLYQAQSPGFLAVAQASTGTPAKTTYRLDTPSPNYTFYSTPDPSFKYLLGYQPGSSSLAVLCSYTGSTFILNDANRNCYPVAIVKFRANATSVSDLDTVTYLTDSGFDYSRSVDVLAVLHTRGLI